MKKRLLLMGVAASLMLFASCTDEDKMLLTAPYRVQGELGPEFRLPVISRSELNLNDLLMSFDGDFSGNLEVNDETIVFLYNGEFSDTIHVNGGAKNAAPRAKGHRAPKTEDDAVLFSIDTVISYPIDIDLFEKVDPNLMNENNRIRSILLNLGATVRGICPENAEEAVSEYVTARIDSLKVGYRGNDGVYRTDFDLPNISLTVDDLLNEHPDTMWFKDIDLAPIFNRYPSHLDFSFNLHMIVDTGFATENTQDLEHIQHFQELLDSLGMTQLLYDANVSVRIPFEVHIEELSYPFSLSLRGEGSENASIFDRIDTILNSLLGDGAASIDSSSVTAYLVLENGIPLNFTLEGTLVDENGNPLQNGKILAKETVPSAGTIPTGVSGITKADPNNPGRTLIEIPLTMGQLEAFTEANALQLKLGLFTDGTDYKRVSPNDFLRMSLQVKLSPDIVIDMQLFRGFGDILGGLPVVGRFFNN